MLLILPLITPFCSATSATEGRADDTAIVEGFCLGNQEVRLEKHRETAFRLYEAWVALPTTAKEGLPLARASFCLR
jgi:hypothetical protein